MPPSATTYEILSVSRECDDAGLKSAYRKLALQYHPDRNPNNQDAEERFKEAAEAYSVLSDPQKRAAYDRYGHQGLQGLGSQGFDPSTFTDFGDILGDLFGFGDLFGGAGKRGGGGRNRAQRGEDLRYDLEIPKTPSAVWVWKSGAPHGPARIAARGLALRKWRPGVAPAPRAR